MTLFQHRPGLITLILMVSLIQLLSACQNNGQVNNTEDALSSQTPTKWSVSLHTSGGLRGENKNIAVDHQGVAQFTNSRSKITETGQISTVNLNRLAEMVKNYTPTTAKKGSKAASCRDCYYYVISVEYDGNVNRQQSTDLNMDDSLKPLIGVLKKISSELEQQSK